MLSDFAPPWWLSNPHLQTVWGRLVRRRRLVAFRRETVTTPDGDEVLIDHLDQPAGNLPDGGDRSRHFLLLHGLEGSSYSVYMQGILSIIARRGHAATAINFRSCARNPERIFEEVPNRRPRFYHSGETSDFDFVLRTLAARAPGVRLLAFGASLGGNVLLKWLGEHPGQDLIEAAATISVPYDLGAGSQFLESFAGRIYVGSFLRSLKRKIRDVIGRFPETADIIDVPGALAARTFREFDEAATGPLHGFTGANDYYARASSINFLGRITTPTLCLSAEDDPFLPKEALLRAKAAASPFIEFRTTPAGGHVGFVAGSTPWACTYWAEELIVEWLLARNDGTGQRQATAAVATPGVA
jgi:predicted alpha/beta-fold hydrolase